MNTDDPKPREPLGRRRPILITLLCAMGFIGFPFTVIQLTDPTIKAEIIGTFGEDHYKRDILSACLFLFSYVGYWMMKRWGVLMCLVLTVSTIWYYLLLGMPIIFLKSGLNIVILLVGIAYQKQMD